MCEIYVCEFMHVLLKPTRITNKNLRWKNNTVTNDVIVARMTKIAAFTNKKKMNGRHTQMQFTLRGIVVVKSNHIYTQIIKLKT